MVLSWQALAGAVIAVRIAAVFLTRTYASPDEYWQGPEIAHKLVFGIGFVTWGE